MGSGGRVSVGRALLFGFVLVACRGKTTHAPSDSDQAGESSGTDGEGGSKVTRGGNSASGGASFGDVANGGVGDRGPDSGKSTDLDDFLVGEGQGFCARLFRCNEANDDFLSERLLLGSAERCEDLLARVNARSHAMRDLRAQIAAGNIHYVPERGAQCLQELAECNGPNSLTDGACREAFDGNAKTGEPCQRSEDCAGDAYCNNQATCPGQCLARKATDLPCQRDNECAYTTGVPYCDHDAPESALCRTLPVAPKAAKGQPCTRNLNGSASVMLCQDELWCQTLPGGDPASDMLGACALPLELNAACLDEDDVCDGSFCDTTAGKCRAITLQKKAGDTCDRTAGVVCDPLLGLRCNAAGTCDGSGDGSAGSACFTGDFKWNCDPGLYCAKPADATSETPGTCRALLDDARTCDTSSSCASGNCASGTCVSRPCGE